MKSWARNERNIMGGTQGLGQRPANVAFKRRPSILVARGRGRGYIPDMLALSPLRRSRPFLMLILASSVVALAGAFAGQHLFGLEPCVLCLWQRVPFALAAIIAASGLVARHPGYRLLSIALSAVVFALGAALAFFHVGVQQHWWSSVPGCGGVPVSGMSLEDLSAAALANPPKPCDVVDWQLFGLSLAGWNTLASTALAAACLIAFTLLRKNPHP